MEDLHWATCGLWMLLDVTPEPPQKRFLSKNVIFRGLRLSLDYFGQQAHQSHMSQPGVSTSFLPPFIVDLSTFKDYPRSDFVMYCKLSRTLFGLLDNRTFCQEHLNFIIRGRAYIT